MNENIRRKPSRPWYAYGLVRNKSSSLTFQTWSYMQTILFEHSKQEICDLRVAQIITSKFLLCYKLLFINYSLHFLVVVILHFEGCFLIRIVFCSFILNKYIFLLCVENIWFFLSVKNSEIVSVCKQLVNVLFHTYLIYYYSYTISFYYF